MADFSLFTTIRFDTALFDIANNPSFTNAGWNYENRSAWYMLDYHRDRLCKAAAHWGWEAAIHTISGEQGIARLEALRSCLPPEADTAPYRVKIILSQDGKLACEHGPTSRLSMESLLPQTLPQHSTTATSEHSLNGLPSRDPEFQVLIDTKMTTHTEFTHYKTTKRFMYDAARARLHLNVKDQKEVLITNDNDGSIMEGSIMTPYFWRNERWVTPPVSNGYKKRQGSGGCEGTTRRWALERGLAVEEVIPAHSLKDGEECWLSNGLRGFIFGRVKISPV
ncbi:putative 4-amino-4-deoxychorismate protein [Xylariales sp. PMI_506]|nr:putative 4-amino-4-deoxychorismate protein [Xylariales sp. PMI_506]